MEKIEINIGAIADTRPEEKAEDRYGHITICINIAETTLTEYGNTGEAKTKMAYVFDCYQFVDRQISSDEIIDKLVRLKYGISEELSTLRQKETKSSEFSTYFDYCESCKTLGKKLFNLLNDIA